MALDTQLAQGFKGLNRLMLLMWRLGLGRWVNVWPEAIGRVMVIGHTGRKSGRHLWTPVNYAPADGDILCTAGFGAGSDWYRNVMAHPQIEVWLPDGWWEATAEDISESPERLPLLRKVLVASGFAAPLFGVHPQTDDDARLTELTESYRLLRIRRTAARTGPGGPGDLAWIWPLAALGLLMLLPLRRPRRATR